MKPASPELIASYLLAQAGIAFPIKPILLNPPKPALPPAA